jgi:hypothetical protein
VTPERVPAALLLFPEFAQLVVELKKWVAGYNF